MGTTNSTEAAGGGGETADTLADFAYPVAPVEGRQWFIFGTHVTDHAAPKHCPFSGWVFLSFRLIASPTVKWPFGYQKESSKGKKRLFLEFMSRQFSQLAWFDASTNSPKTEAFFTHTCQINSVIFFITL